MPIKDLKNSQRQGRIFADKLSKELDRSNKLYQLNQFINWDNLEIEILKLTDVKDFGRERKSVRVMTALVMLQSMYNFSDYATSEAFPFALRIKASQKID